jgi:hypothetical protein
MNLFGKTGTKATVKEISIFKFQIPILKFQYLNSKFQQSKINNLKSKIPK